MALERTLSIIKPDATQRNITGKINARIEGIHLRIIAQRRVWLLDRQIQMFYKDHKDKAFFKELCAYMCSSPVVLQVLEGVGAISKYRELMGATDPSKAEPGTIRKDFAQGIMENSVHGSDSLAMSEIEIAFFFSQMELVG